MSGLSTAGQQTVLANHKTSAKLSWKRKEAMKIAEAIHEYFDDRGFPLPGSHRAIFGRKFKATETLKNLTLGMVRTELKQQGVETVSAADMLALKKNKVEKLREEHELEQRIKGERFFTDKETGECQYEELIELARAYFTLKNGAPAVYALFKHKTNNHYLKQLVALTCSTHRLDPVWNYKKSKLIRGIWYRFLKDSKIQESYRPMHLMLTVPHKDGEWHGKRFYAREFIQRFNIMRKSKLWKECIYGGEYGIEVTRKGASGLHIHMHCLVFQDKAFSRDEVNERIRKMWNELTGSEITWYETLYVHRKDESGKFIMEETAAGIPLLDKRGQWSDEVNSYDISSELIRGKRKKFYLDESDPWFLELDPDQRLNHYLDGVMECIKYHFKTDCFKAKDGSWDVELMREVLQHSKYLRMYSKFGAFYKEKALNYSRLEKPQLKDDVTAMVAEGVDPYSDGVEDRLNNPYTGQPAQKGEYVRVMALPELTTHVKDKKGNTIAPVGNKAHDNLFVIDETVPIAHVINAIMRSQYDQVLIQDDLERFRKGGWHAPRETPIPTFYDLLMHYEFQPWKKGNLF